MGQIAGTALRIFHIIVFFLSANALPQKHALSLCNMKVLSTISNQPRKLWRKWFRVSGPSVSFVVLCLSTHIHGTDTLVNLLFLSFQTRLTSSQASTPLFDLICKKTLDTTTAALLCKNLGWVRNLGKLKDCRGRVQSNFVLRILTAVERPAKKQRLTIRFRFLAVSSIDRQTVVVESEVQQKPLVVQTEGRQARDAFGKGRSVDSDALCVTDRTPH